MMESSLCIYKGKIQEAINLVPGMDAEYKLKAVQYWNAVSEHLQEIVNKSAPDFNTLDATVESRHDVTDRNSDQQQQQVITSNQPQASSPPSLETQVYNIISNSSISCVSNELLFNEFLPGDNSECGSGLTSPSDQAQQGASKKEDLSDDNQTNNMSSASDTNNTDDDSLMTMMERTIKDSRSAVKDSSNTDNTTNMATFATGTVLNMSQRANQQPTTNLQQAVIVTTENNLIANTLTTSRTSPLTNGYMIDTSTILPSRIQGGMSSTRVLIGQSDSTPVSSPTDDTTRVNTISSSQTLNPNDINSLQQNSLINVDSRNYMSSSNHIASGLSTNLRAQTIQAHPPLIPPIITSAATPIMQSHSVLPSHCSPIETYHTSAIQHHQLQPLNGYDHHMAIQHSRPLHPHQLINFEMVGLNPEFNYIQTFPCDVCGKQLDSSEDLSQHREMHITESHSELDREHGRITVNMMTDSSATSPSNQANLSNVGSNQHACNICGKSGFSTKGNLKRHLRAHSGEKPFKCEYCESRFTEKKSLKIHLRRHTGEKPYKCDICGKLFSQTGVLQSHMALHLNERKFGCNLCGKAFRQRSQLKLHIMRHEGVKRLECSTCSAKFLTKGDLERHYRIHTGERPYECKLCKKTFTRQQSLNEHLNRHYGTKPYSCPSCDKTFSEMSACYKHAKIHKKQETS